MSVALQVGVLHEQTERQSHRIQDLEKVLSAKKDLLRHTEQALERERNATAARTNLLTLQVQ